MIYITQLIYIVPGEEKTFDEFERVAIPLISKYNGRLLFRLRPTKDTFIGDTAEKPYEVHLVEFSTEQDFTNFGHDPERKTFLHLKEKAIRASVLIKGAML